MSTESSSQGPKRRYRKRNRARQEEETRRRITEGVVELHRTVGPARTTVADVAARAGVSRMTVYNHFPTEADLVAACSAHWSARNPFPDACRWQQVTDPAERLRLALRELYGWYARTEDMMGKVLRDASLVPSLGRIVEESWGAYLTRAVEVLSSGRGRSASAARLPLRLALDFATWRTVSAERQDAGDAARWVARMVEATTAAAAAASG